MASSDKTPKQTNSNPDNPHLANIKQKIRAKLESSAKSATMTVSHDGYSNVDTIKRNLRLKLKDGLDTVHPV
jgi:adenine C2-methylase RlmN of 23S rRNA A2503 and tRNA A37